MKARPPTFLEKYRITKGIYASEPGGIEGAYEIPSPDDESIILKVIVGTGMRWDHVSVSLKDRCPTWVEMEYIKRMFFKPDETAFQIHPPVDEYVNFHPYALHIWKHQTIEIPRPNKMLVGPS